MHHGPLSAFTNPAIRTWPELSLHVGYAALFHLFDDGPPVAVVEESAPGNLKAQDGGAGPRHLSGAPPQYHVPYHLGAVRRELP